MLKEIAERACKINNRSNTLKWGSRLEDNRLVLVCGHPSIPSVRSKITYFICRENFGQVSVVVEVSGTVRDSFQEGVDSTITYILTVLKEVYG